MKIEVYNLNGQKIKTLLNVRKQAGYHTIQFIAEDEKGIKLSSGIYVYVMRAGDFRNVKKLTIIK